jgi:hypothetical protein
MAMKQGFGGRVGIEFEGQWVKLTSLMSHHSHLIRAAATQGELNVAKRYVRLLKSNIRNGGLSFHYPPLSPEYAKKRKGNKMFIFTKSLHDAIDIIEGSHGNIGAGVPDGVERGGRPISLEVAEYATILEKGSKGKGKQPPRPIFSDTFKQMGGKEAIAFEVRKQLYILYKLFGFKI